ncbi:hypothetical protein [Pengzhenrongella phosphoraccumulans]|uniref:hypothetical protein n=1 Tax=Pengzhenrongella phosphoraccumulans TaxID=3114394 RepID=UPI0038903B3C
MADWYQREFVATGRSGALWLMISFLVTYAATRHITRTIRARAARGDTPQGGAVKDVHIGGVHIHHQVWGILLALTSGLLEFRFRPDSPGLEVLAALFGAGAALALDEFALWLHLEDVYWTEEGRKSIDAVMVASVLGVALLIGATPAGLTSDALASDGLAVLIPIVVLHVTYTVVCLLKGKLVYGLVGFFVPILALVGAVRVAKPESFWAKRFYGEAKAAKSRARFGSAYEARRERLRDVFSGGRVG